MSSVKSSKFLPNFLVAIFYLILAVFLCLASSLTLVLTFPSKKSVQDLAKSDCGIVLGAGLDAEGKPSPVFVSRLETAEAAYKAGKIERLILTGGFGREWYSLPSISDSAAAKKYLESQEIPADKIFIEEDSNTTLKNLQEAKEIAEAINCQKLVIISDHLHLFRASQMAQKLEFKDAQYLAVLESRYQSLRTQSQFAISESYWTWQFWLVGR